MVPSVAPAQRPILQDEPGKGSGRRRLDRRLERIAQRVTHWVGGSWALFLAVLVVVSWLATGPLFDYSQTWQLVINTGTTIVTFLMVFLIQRSQNKESRAMQLKLNELVAAMKGASNRLIDAEGLTEEELDVLAKHYQALIDRAKSDSSMTESHSIDEAERRHAAKRRA
jgi:low affinity Fe/Cu permease